MNTILDQLNRFSSQVTGNSSEEMSHAKETHFYCLYVKESEDSPVLFVKTTYDKSTHYQVPENYQDIDLPTNSFVKKKLSTYFDNRGKSTRYIKFEIYAKDGITLTESAKSRHY